MCKITKTIMSMIDEKDPNQRLFGLVAQLTDNRIGELEVKISDLKDVHTKGLEETKKAFSDLKKVNEDHYQRLESSVASSLIKIQESIDNHNNRCPFNMEERILIVQNDIKDTKVTIAKFKWLEALMDFPLMAKFIIVGIFALIIILSSFGIDKIITIIK